jgi:hypothetical protein
MTFQSPPCFAFFSVFCSTNLPVGCLRNKKKIQFEPKQTETNQKNPKSSKKYQNMLGYQTVSVFSLFGGFNQNIETLCFGIEAKEPKQTVSKQTKETETNQINPKFSDKIPK